MQILRLGYLVRVLFVCGFALGALVGPFLVVYDARSGATTANLILTIILTPLANGLFAAAYGFFGYPVYRFLARRRKLRLGEIDTVDIGGESR